MSTRIFDLSPSPSGEGLGWGRAKRASAPAAKPPRGHRAPAAADPTPTPPLKGRGEVTHPLTLLLLTLLLAACSPSENTADPLAVAEAQAEAQADNDGRVNCATNGLDAFARACAIDRTEGDKGLVLTIHHPDGHFRRLLVTKDGRGVIAADGAEEAKVSVIGSGEIEVALAGDRYRLPATVKGQPGPQAAK